MQKISFFLFVHDENENSDWLPERAEYYNTEHSEIASSNCFFQSIAQKKRVSSLAKILFITVKLS